ncbi:MAG: ATP-binding protein [Lachnospiraceae bacterium]
MIFIEQPEIHLHPDAQALLADVIMDAVNMREDGKDRNVQIIIETHSEHLLQRVQRRISEEKLPASDIQAYFAQNNRQASKLDELGELFHFSKNQTMEMKIVRVFISDRIMENI